MISGARTILKLTRFLWVSALALFDFAWNIRGRGDSLQARADWCHRWANRYLEVLGIELTRRGLPPNEGVLVCNHLSYVDIVVLGAARKQIFLSKREVKSWPIIGALSQCAGTLYVNRERRGDVAKLQNAFAEVIDAGLPITLFPEGTSSDGSKVMPFYSSLLEPAVRGAWAVTPSWLGYRLDEGSVADEVCYWRDMTFLPHFLKLLSKKRIYATVVFGQPVSYMRDRKELAARLHREVSAMAEQGQSRPRTPTPEAEELATAI
jgi:lyso-ornithine lipid O-acyltransferase